MSGQEPTLSDIVAIMNKMGDEISKLSKQVEEQQHALQRGPANMTAFSLPTVEPKDFLSFTSWNLQQLRTSFQRQQALANWQRQVDGIKRKLNPPSDLARDLDYLMFEVKKKLDVIGEVIDEEYALASPDSVIERVLQSHLRNAEQTHSLRYLYLELICQKKAEVARKFRDGLIEVTIPADLKVAYHRARAGNNLSQAVRDLGGQTADGPVSPELYY